MIHFHGTPITPRAQLLAMAGRHFCVSYARPDDEAVCRRIGASVFFDNGAFSVFKGVVPRRAGGLDGFAGWVDQRLIPPHWCAIPDVIGGSEDDQRTLVASWSIPKSLSAPVWHIHLSHDWLCDLVDRGFYKVCFGSSGEFWDTKSDAWTKRVDETFDMLIRRYGRVPNLHMLRAMDRASKGPWPFASADSTNVARNHARTGCAETMAARIDSTNPHTAGDTT